MTSPSLYERSLERFDDLNRAGELLYNPTEPERITRNGFIFRFRQSKALTTKPLTAIHNPKTSKNPFLPPDEEFIISRPNESHTMILNKFCPLRPMLLIHTNEFESQNNDLNLSDISAVWSTFLELSEGLDKLNAKGREEEMEGDDKELMATYGCGADAGASQGHKHCQIFPKDGPLWPDDVLDKIPVFPQTTTHSSPPYQHYITRLPPSPTPEKLYEIYLALLQPTKQHTQAYNFVLTKDWMLLIPRTKGKKGEYGVNAAGMMGMVWIKSVEERNAWDESDLTGFLEYCALPNEARKEENGA
ncbi:hypothetical protein BJ508DRAFT_361559 [Ascobolus immersus RN42]|uniref:Uncharacterized protein n=1 Tax=Ascobolus immersus RN42 TaxID=1160509 RepID=A0A3N4I781_ASCIM|nr:hypothetical protein BJ508DRAFT_361559 [Ascobolus immersus RN42]